MLEPGRPADAQSVPVRLLAPPGQSSLELYVDGKSVGVVGSPFVKQWALARGSHVLVAQAEPGLVSLPVHVTVE